MDALAPPLKALLNIKLKIQTGTSTREAIREFSKEFSGNEMAHDLGLYLFMKESDQPVDHTPFKKPYRKMLLEVLERGLDGE